MPDLMIEPSRRRIRALVQGHAIGDTTHALLVLGAGLPFYAFPMADVTLERIRASGRTATRKLIGTVHLHDILEADGQPRIDAAWTTRQARLAGYCMFAWAPIDRWLEEDDHLPYPPRDIYKRVDAVPSSRRVQLRLGDRIVADSRRAMFLFETGIKTRYYFPPDDIDPAILRPSALRTGCIYKGEAHYHDVVLDGTVHENLVWTYPDPVPECGSIAGLFAFANERLDEILIDGVALDRLADPLSNAAIAAAHVYVRPRLVA